MRRLLVLFTFISFIIIITSCATQEAAQQPAPPAGSTEGIQGGITGTGNEMDCNNSKKECDKSMQ